MKFLLLIFLSLATSLAGDKIGSIQLEDQFGKNHQTTFPAERSVVVTVADMKGAESMDPWLAALKKQFSTNVAYLGIADVRAVPRPLRPFVRSQFKKKYSYSVLLDWNGTTLKKLSPAASVPNIYLLSPSGEIVQHLHGRFSEERFAQLLKSPHSRSTARK